MTNIAIHLTQWSKLGASDPTVVLVHGGAQGSARGGDQQFSRQSQLATQGWRVIAPDRPGHGRSPSPGRPDDAEADGLWVADLIGEGAHLVGHSFGGSVALAARRAAARRGAVADTRSSRRCMRSPSTIRGFKSSSSTMAVHAGAVRGGGRDPLHEAGIVPAEVSGPLSAAELERMGDGLRRMKLPSPDWLRSSLEKVKAQSVPALVVTGGWSPAFEAVGDVVARLCGGLPGPSSPPPTTMFNWRRTNSTCAPC